MIEVCKIFEGWNGYSKIIFLRRVWWELNFVIAPCELWVINRICAFKLVMVNRTESWRKLAILMNHLRVTKRFMLNVNCLTEHSDQSIFFIVNYDSVFFSHSLISSQVRFLTFFFLIFWKMLGRQVRKGVAVSSMTLCAERNLLHHEMHNVNTSRNIFHFWKQISKAQKNINSFDSRGKRLVGEK